MNDIHLTIVSPERLIFDGNVSQVTLPGEIGEFQVLANHAPLISSLVAGDVKYTSTETVALKISSGFVDINRNQVSVCVELDG
ncbi:MAG TPA: F0F1 ATP synthase subunit epsilon [Candidatus Phocaeicola gallistercoris]|jgi:F-type H+-transporting ATPase subunit epsilon|nr:F0F1 ATP synthase subunit epsilon [Candidatus Phocaeicola gallistercoris]